MRKRTAIAMMVLANASAQAQPCQLDSLTLDRGETRTFLICSEHLPERAFLQSNPASGVTISYQQRLKRCSQTDPRTGFYIKVHANDFASSTPLTAHDVDTGSGICAGIRIEVPQRLRLPNANLSASAALPGSYQLEIVAPKGVVFSRSGPSGLIFSPSDGLSLRETTDSPAPTGIPMAGSSARILTWVVAENSREGPAKIIVRGVHFRGHVGEGVTYAEFPPAPWLDSMAPADAKFVDINGIRTRYFDAGSGEALLLVHGGQPTSADGTAWDWQQNFVGLAQHFHVYALDRLGQGYTDNPRSAEDYENYYPRVVDHLYAFIKAMGLKRVHLVGHSQGSWPVTRIAIDHPDEILSLTLVDGTMVAPPRDGGQAIGFYRYLSEDLHPESGATLESVRRGMELFSYTRNNLTDQRVDRILTMDKLPKFAEARAWFSKTGMSPAHPAFRALKAQVLQELGQGKLKVPVLIIWGRNDPEGSLESGLELFRILSSSNSKARLYVFGHSGHLSFVEYPTEFNAVLGEFCLNAQSTL